MTGKRAVPASAARRRVFTSEFTAEFTAESVRRFESRRAQGVSQAQIAGELDGLWSPRPHAARSRSRTGTPCTPRSFARPPRGPDARR